MPESLPPELVELRRAAIGLAAGPLTELRDRTDIDRRELTALVVEASTAAGIRPLTLTSLDGAPSAGALALVVVREALAGHDVIHLPGIFAPAPGLLASVDEPLRSRYLEPLLAGRKQGAFGFTEPAEAERHTWAVVDGGNLIVNGEKSYVTGGGDADFVNTLIEVDGLGPAMVVIDADAAGVEITRRFESLDGSHHAAFAFRNVRVPVTNVVGTPGKGMGRAMAQVGGVRMAIAATCLGLAANVVEQVERYLAAPHRGGSPLGDAERHRLRYGQMRIKTFAARSSVYRAARIVDAGAAQGERAINEIMMAKYLATETVGEVVDAAVQTIGGQALTVGHPLESIHRRVRSLRLAEGASDVLACNIARGRLELVSGTL